MMSFFGLAAGVRSAWHGRVTECDHRRPRRDRGLEVRLSSISIANHSRVADVSVRARRHVVIVGANNVGKTSILRLLNLVLGTSTAGLYQSLGMDDLRDPELPLLVDLTLAEFTDAERTLFPYEISVAEDGVTEYMKVQLRVERDLLDDEALAIHRWFPESGHERAPTREQVAGFGWRYMRSNRAGSSSMLEGPDSAVRTLLASADLGGSRNALIKLLKDFNQQLGGTQAIKELLEGVATHLNRSMPQEMKSSDFAIQSTADPDKDVLGNVSLFLRREERSVPLADQSDGVKQLMAMTLFDLAEGTANMLAIDEPELHLHPASQRTISELLSGEGNQKILVTHSPYIVHRFEPAEVVSLDHLGQAHQVSNDALSVVEKQRVSWWSPRLLEALTSRYVIVVEGLADRIIVEGAARAMNIDLDRLGAAVLELDGADKFPHVYKLIGKHGFGVTLLGLVDEKESPRWLGTVGGRPKNVIDKTIFISRGDLEDEYCTGLTAEAAAHALIAAQVCDEKAITNSAQVSSLAEVDAPALAAYCRDRKVEAASAIAASLTDETARTIASVSKLLWMLEGMELL